MKYKTIFMLALFLTFLFSCKKNSFDILLKYESEVMKLTDDKEYEEALSLCDKMGKINSDYLPIYLYRGIIFMEIEQFENAEFEFTKTLEKNEHVNLWLPRQLTTVYAWRSTARMEQQKFDLAKSDANECISIYDNDSKGYQSLAAIYYRNKEYKESLIVLDTMISKFPDVFETYYMRSVINYFLQEYESSITDCNYFINNYPDEIKFAFYIRSLAYIALQKYELALLDLNRVEEIFPEENWFYNSLAYTYFKLGDTEKTKKYYLTSTEIIIKAKSNNMSNLTYEFTKKIEVKEVFQEINEISKKNIE